MLVSLLERKEFRRYTDSIYSEIVPRLQVIRGDRIVNIHDSLRKHGLESAGSALSPDYKFKFTLDAVISHVSLMHCSVGHLHGGIEEEYRTGH